MSWRWCSCTQAPRYFDNWRQNEAKMICVFPPGYFLFPTKQVCQTFKHLLSTIKTTPPPTSSQWACEIKSPTNMIFDNNHPSTHSFLCYTGDSTQRKKMSLPLSFLDFWGCLPPKGWIKMMQMLAQCSSCVSTVSPHSSRNTWTHRSKTNVTLWHQ